jgi:hypothetical protein
MKEYKNIHSVIFYLLSFICVMARIVNMALFYKGLKADFGEEPENANITVAINIAYFISVYFKIALGYA